MPGSSTKSVQKIVAIGADTAVCGCCRTSASQENSQPPVQIPPPDLDFFHSYKSVQSPASAIDGATAPRLADPHTRRKVVRHRDHRAPSGNPAASSESVQYLPALIHHLNLRNRPPVKAFHLLPKRTPAGTLLGFERVTGLHATSAT
jgi:hypothetical protein